MLGTFNTGKMELTSVLRLNPKHMGTSYLKSESQTLWARNAARKQKMPVEDTPTHLDQRYVFISLHSVLAFCDKH